MNSLLKIFLLFLVAISPLYASLPNEGLIAVISGKVTTDGRPLLCQNLSNDNPNEKLHYFRGEKYDFAGLITSNDSTKVWLGQNSIGLSIVGTAVEVAGEDSLSEGHVIKQALGSCARVDEFEQFLQNIKSSFMANFGCIDKFGNAAIFEFSPQKVLKLDANNPLDSKDGFLVRSNFAFSQKIINGQGAFRYHRAIELIKTGISQDSLNSKFLFQHILRDIKTEKGDPLENANGKNINSKNEFFATDQSINQYNTVSGAVFSSAVNGDQYSQIPFWCALGEPLSSVFLPVWTTCSKLPEDLSDGDQVEMNLISIETKKELYYTKSDPRLIDINEGLKGKNPIFNLITSIENDIFQKVENQIKIWSNSTEPTIDNICQFQHKIISDAIRQIR